MAWLTDPFSEPFMQRALVAALLLAVAGGLLGAWVLLRRLAFFTHAVGTATFPGLVLAAPLGIAPPLAALGTGLGFAGALSRLAPRRGVGADAGTGLLLVAAVALGAILAGDVYHSGPGVDRLLFGTLVGLSPGDLWLAAGVAALALLASAACGRAWLAAGFDGRAAAALGVRVAVADWLLLAALAVAVVAALPAVGALLVSALFVVPAASARLLARSVRGLQAWSVGLAAAEAVAGLWLAWRLDLPPGPAIAVLAGAVFAVAALARRLGRRRGTALAVLLAGGALGGAGAAGGGVAVAHGRLDVVATTTQVADLVRHVAGPRVAVHGLLRPDVDPHEYEPRPSDVAAVGRARIAFRSGGSVDAWLGDVLDQAGGGRRVVDLAHAVHLRGDDPHWWHDPVRARRAVRAIRAALTAADPAGAAGYRARAARELARLRALQRDIARCLDRLPPGERTLVTGHEAFGYLLARYGLRSGGAVIPSLSDAAEASAGEVARLVDAIRSAGLRAVFAEQTAGPRLLQAIADASGARVVTLYADSLGPAGSPGATYLGAERANARRIAAGLSGGEVRCP